MVVAHSRPRPDPAPPGDGRVAVVVITRNRAEEAAATVDGLRRLPERPTVVVVDNGSEDGTAERLAGRDVTLIALRDNLGAAGRNLGVRAVDVPYVAFCDDDSRWAPGALARAADVLDAHPRVGALCGRVTVGDGDDPTCAEMAASAIPARSGLPGVPVLGFLACATVVRRSAFLAAGGFEPRFLVGGEEELLALDLAAAGWDIVYVADVVAGHSPSVHRDRADRRRIVARNALWTAWLRYPPAAAWRRTTEIGRAALADPPTRRGVVEAARAWRWVRHHRRPLPPAVVTALAAKLGGGPA